MHTTGVPSPIKQKRRNKMDLFFDKKVTTTKTATTLTEVQFATLKRVIGRTVVDGIHRNTNDEVFLSAIRDSIRTEEGLEITDEDIVSIINNYGEISFLIDLSGTLSTEFSHELLITEEELGDRDEDDLHQMSDDDFENEFGLDAGETDYYDLRYESADVECVTTCLLVSLPTPEEFAITPLKDVA
jgi:hypothetical protein